MCDKLIVGTVCLPDTKEAIRQLTVLNRTMIVLFFKSSYQLFNLHEQVAILTMHYEWEFSETPPLVYSREELILRLQHPMHMILLNVLKGSYTIIYQCYPQLCYSVICFSDSKQILIGVELPYGVSYESYPSKEKFEWQTNMMNQSAFDREGTLVATFNKRYRTGKAFKLLDTNTKQESTYIVSNSQCRDWRSVANYGKQLAVIVGDAAGYEPPKFFVYNLEKRIVIKEFELPSLNKIWMRPQFKQLMIEERLEDGKHVVSLACLKTEWLETVGSFALEPYKLANWNQGARVAVYLQPQQNRNVLKVFRTYNNRSRYVHLMDNLGIISKYPRKLCDEVLKLLC